MTNYFYSLASHTPNPGSKKSFFKKNIIISFHLSESECDLLRDSVHVTSAAARPNNELWCYKCLAEVPDDRCADLRHNNSALIHKCHNDRRMCMVMTVGTTYSCRCVGMCVCVRVSALFVYKCVCVCLVRPMTACVTFEQ